jgi:pimeloyl-ACP methyl ester carboxylesterase
MYYEIHGKGEPLVFVNGRHMCLDLLYRHVPVFAREYRVITLDNRGTGKSDAPDAPYSLEVMAQDLAGLLDAIGIDKAHFAGYSMGARIVEEMALSFPERVISLILACPITWSADLHNQPEPAPEEEQMRWEALPLEERVRSFLSGVVSEEFIGKNQELAEKMVKIIMEGYGPPQGQKGHAYASVSYDNYRRVPEIKAPTLIMAGSADKTISLDNIHILKERLQGAELAVLDKVGHFFMWEAFDESNRIMLEFLWRHRTKKA